MKLSELKAELHYDPLKTARTTELAVEKAKEKIESIEKYIEMLKGLRTKNDKGEYEIPESRKEEIKKWEEILKAHKKFVAEKEEDIKKYRKELEAVDEIDEEE